MKYRQRQGFERRVRLFENNQTKPKNEGRAKQKIDHSNYMLFQFQFQFPLMQVVGCFLGRNI